MREIAEHYAFDVGVEGAFRRLSGQIADEARKVGPGAFTDDFGRFYDFGPVAFSHGDGMVRGIFIGVVENWGDMLAIRGESTFAFSDLFVNQLDIGVEPGGTPFEISADWTASFSAEVLKHRSRSIYFDPNEL